VDLSSADSSGTSEETVTDDIHVDKTCVEDSSSGSTTETASVETIKIEPTVTKASKTCSKPKKNFKQPKQSKINQPNSNQSSKTKTPAMKRQTCFNCGIAGHIARNCIHPPHVHSKHLNAHLPKVKPNQMHNHWAKPSDFDWNAPKKGNQKWKKGFQNNKFSSFGTYNSERPLRYWKPKIKADQSTNINKHKSPSLNNQNLIWKKVIYFDEHGRPRSTMGWVSRTN
jgi:hypothetical protein